jgi:hypothetical protein
VIPGFVSEIIEGGLRASTGGGLSFIAIVETLEANGFRIVADVDSDSTRLTKSPPSSAALNQRRRAGKLNKMAVKM